MYKLHLQVFLNKRVMPKHYDTVSVSQLVLNIYIIRMLDLIILFQLL